MGTYVPYDPKSETFLNNFYTRFPSGMGRFPDGLARSVGALHWNQKYSITCRGYFDSQEDFDDYCLNYSDKYLNETPEQFFAEVDKTLVEVGLTLEGIRVEIMALMGDGSTLQVCLLRDKYLEPVYIALRRKGYNKKELWG